MLNFNMTETCGRTQEHVLEEIREEKKARDARWEKAWDDMESRRDRVRSEEFDKHITLLSKLGVLLLGTVAVITVPPMLTEARHASNNKLGAAVADNPHMAKLVIAKAQDKAFDAKTETKIDSDIKTFATKYFPGHELTAKTWQENYQTIAAEALLPENISSRTMLEDFAKMTGTINALVDKEPLKIIWKQLPDLQTTLGAKPPRTYIQEATASG